jgi:RNA polymerase sigma-70 factor, ECF subfamily
VTESASRWQSQGGGQRTTDPTVCQKLSSEPPIEATDTPTSPGVELACIYEEEADFVWHRLRRLGVAERDLEDKVHDVFVIVHRQLASYDRSRPLRPWLAGISVRVAMRYHRGANQGRMVLMEVERTDEHGGPDRRLEERQAQGMVLAALGELPLEQRTVLVLKELDGFAMPEIAEMLDVPLNTLYSRLRLARQKFSSAVAGLRGRESER